MAKMLSILSVTLLVIYSVSSSRAQCLTENDNLVTLNKNVAEILADARLSFGLESLKHVADIVATENIFFSPQSIHEAVTLVYFGARKHTEAQLKKSLLIPDELSKADVQKFYYYEQGLEAERQNKSFGNYEFKIANGLWLSDKKKLRECMVRFFGNELRLANFRSNPAMVRKQINDWVSSVTKNNIQDFLPANSIDESTDAVLANAVYFKGLWQSQFLPENTKRDYFYHSPRNMTVTQFMRQKGSFSYLISEELGADILELPYKGDDVSMYVFLPTLSTPTGVPLDLDVVLRQFIRRITTDPEGIREFRDILDTGMPARDVEVTLPKFTIEKNLPVKELLSSMGASPVLEPDTSDLTGFVADGESGPYLGDAVHRAKIEVSEEGTTAAAATALFSFRSSRPTEPAIFNANHPFLYFIYDRQSRSMLFAGVYRKPNGTPTNYQ